MMPQNLLRASGVALLLAFLVVPLVGCSDDADLDDGVETEVIDDPVVVTAEEPDAPVSDLSLLLDADDAGIFVGQQVALSGVNAVRVSGDSTFWVSTPGDDQRLFVVLANLGESELGAGGTDGVYDVDSGETFTVEGVVQAVTPEQPDAWGVTGADRDALEGQIYIRASSLRGDGVDED